MINMGICDDDKEIINEIKKYIEEYRRSEYLISTYNSGEELIKEEKRFQIIFLDIDMGGINGIETAKKIRMFDKNVKIIYVTNVGGVIFMQNNLGVYVSILWIMMFALSSGVFSIKSKKLFREGNKNEKVI